MVDSFNLPKRKQRHWCLRKLPQEYTELESGRTEAEQKFEDTSIYTRILNHQAPKLSAASQEYNAERVSVQGVDMGSEERKEKP